MERSDCQYARFETAARSLLISTIPASGCECETSLCLSSSSTVGFGQDGKVPEQGV